LYSYASVYLYSAGFCVIVNLHFLPTVINIAGIIWKACHDKTGQSRFVSTFVELENSCPCR